MGMSVRMRMLTNPTTIWGIHFGLPLDSAAAAADHGDDHHHDDGIYVGDGGESEDEDEDEQQE
eukprot:9472238-Pyramimonas_sp.AAC.1